MSITCIDRRDSLGHVDEAVNVQSSALVRERERERRKEMNTEMNQLSITYAAALVKQVKEVNLLLKIFQSHL